jgi:hypothetical protein
MICKSASVNREGTCNPPWNGPEPRQEHRESKGSIPVAKRRERLTEPIGDIMRESVRAVLRRAERTAHASSPSRKRPGERKKLLNNGHGFPFGRLSPRKGKGAFRQCSALVGKWAFPLDEASGFRGRSCRQTDRFPGPGRTWTRPQGGFRASGLYSVLVAAESDQFPMTHRATRQVNALAAIV